MGEHTRAAKLVVSSDNSKWRLHFLFIRKIVIYFYNVQEQLHINYLTPEQSKQLAELLLWVKDVQTKADAKPLHSWITEYQITEYFGWNKKVLQRARRDGLPYARRGNMFIYLVTDFNLWMQANYSKLELDGNVKSEWKMKNMIAK